jgi:hypothetical protein
MPSAESLQARVQLSVLWARLAQPGWHHAIIMMMITNAYARIRLNPSYHRTCNTIT